MDPSYWSTIRPNLRPGAVVVVNSSLFTMSVGVPEATVFEVPASDVATELGNPMSAGFVLLGAFVAVTGVVTVDGAVAAMRQLVPAVPHAAPRGQRAGHPGRRRTGSGPGRPSLGRGTTGVGAMSRPMAGEVDAR